MTRLSCWAVDFSLQAFVLPVLGIARDGQVCESSGGRSVTFTTTEATEMSLDISPDGKTLVFDLLGDLYTVTVAGGNATRLVGTRAWEVRPGWSPRSAERRVGKEVVSTCRSRGWTAYTKTK